MTDQEKELIEKWLQPCAAVPIDTDTVRILLNALKERLAQPEQEPVAWRNAALRVGEDLCSVGPFGYYDMTSEQWLDWALSVVTVHAPPQRREWVGLTITERFEIEKAMSKYYDYRHECKTVCLPEFAAAIEAKLREKNHV